MVGLNRDTVSELSLVHGFKDGQSLTHGTYSNSLEMLGVQKAKDVTGYVVL